MEHHERPNGGARAAFTVVELLVVISIIVLLGALVTGVGYALRAKARVDRTRVLIHGIDTALQDYHSTMLYWPEAIGDTPDATKYVELADILVKLEAVKLANVRDERVVDAWQRPIYVMRGGHASPRPDVWSAGPDGQNDRTGNPEDYGDDVVNWGRE